MEQGHEMGDWTCEVIVAADRGRRVLRWYPVLADGSSRAEVEARTADPARSVYGSDTYVRRPDAGAWVPRAGARTDLRLPRSRTVPVAAPDRGRRSPSPGRRCGDGVGTCGARIRQESMPGVTDPFEGSASP